MASQRYCVFCADNFPDGENLFIPRSPLHAPNCSGDICIQCFAEISFRDYCKANCHQEDFKGLMTDQEFCNPDSVIGTALSAPATCLLCLQSFMIGSREDFDPRALQELIRLLEATCKLWRSDRTIAALCEFVEDAEEDLQLHREEIYVLQQALSTVQKDKRSEERKRKRAEGDLTQSKIGILLRDRQITLHLQTILRMQAKKTRFF